MVERDQLLEECRTDADHNGNVLYAKWKQETGGSYRPYEFRFTDSFATRQECAHTYSWAVPNDQAIQTLVDHSPVIEIGAGTGYWAAMVQAAGGDIIAFDNQPLDKSEINHYHPGKQPFFAVQEGDEETATLYPDRTLFLCWPPYDSSMAYRCLKAYRGSTVIFVGEGWGGCTANDDFFELLIKEFEVAKEIDIPQWFGMHDYMTVYKRLL